MKKNTLKKVFAVALTGAMTVSALSGCGSSNTSTSTDTTSSSTSEESTNANETVATQDALAGMEGWEPFADTVTIKVAVYDRGTEGIDSVSNNGFTQYVNENFGADYNVNVEYVPITRSDVMTDYALLAAAGSLPTILMEYDYPKVTQWANDGYLQTFNMDDFAQVAPTYYNRMVELNQLSYSIVNDENYFILAERPYYDTTYNYATFVRMDWLEQVGYSDVPKSYAEFCEAMDKIIEAGIASNPKGGTMVTAAYAANFGFRDYPVDEAEWAQYSSLGTASLSWEPTYKMIKRANEEYNKGYTNPEYYITDSETAKANFINGKTYSYGGYMSASVDWLESFYAANPDAKLAIESNYNGVEEGVMDFPQIRSDNPYGMIIGFGNSATEEQVKAAWMYMEWCTQPDVLYTLQHNDWNNYNNSIDFWCITLASAKADTIEETIAVIAPKGLPQDFTQELIDNYYELREIADKGHAYTDPAFAVAIDAESEYNATLLSLYIEYYDKLVMCNPSEYDSLYEQYSKLYLDAGYQEIIDERLEAYEAGQTTKLPW